MRSSGSRGAWISSGFIRTTAPPPSSSQDPILSVPHRSKAGRRARLVDEAALRARPAQEHVVVEVDVPLGEARDPPEERLDEIGAEDRERIAVREDLLVTDDVDLG